MLGLRRIANGSIEEYRLDKELRGTLYYSPLDNTTSEDFNLVWIESLG